MGNSRRASSLYVEQGGCPNPPRARRRGLVPGTCRDGKARQRQLSAQGRKRSRGSTKGGEGPSKLPQAWIGGAGRGKREPALSTERTVMGAGWKS